jgi:Relaxase/Mobilisation nuclease domain
MAAAGPMIAKISKGSTFAGVGRYLYAVGKNHEAHSNPRAIAGDGVLRDDRRAWRPWSEDMQWCAERRPEIKKPVWHCSLRAAPEDRLLTDEQWARIAGEHITAMGLTGHPWVAVRHGDDHVHIVACRVDGSGKVWKDSHDYSRAMKSARAIEVEHGLAVVDADRPSSRQAKVTASERSRNERLNRGRGRQLEPERVRLADLMRAARDRAGRGGLTGWHHELERAGVLFEAHTTSTGRVSGYRLSLPGWTDPTGAQVWLKASQVDRSMGWQNLKKALGADRPGGDQLPLTAAQLAAQAFPVSAAEIARAARLAGGRPTTDRGPGPIAPATPARRRGPGDRGPGRDGPSR